MKNIPFLREPGKDKIALVILALAILVSAISLVRSIETLGKNFCGFLFSPNLIVSVGQRTEWAGIEKGITPLDRILAVNGSTIRAGKDLTRRIDALSVGDTVVYTVLRGDEILDFSVEIERNTLGNFIIVFLFPFLLGLLFLFFGGMLYFFDFAPRGRLIYLITCSLIGVTCTSMYEAYTTFTLFPILLLYPAIGAFSVHLFSLFPESRMHDIRIRGLLTGLYGCSAILAFFRIFFVRDPEISTSLSEISSLFVFSCICLNAFFLIQGYRDTLNQSLRDKIKVLGIGLVIAGVFVVTWTSSVLSDRAVFPLDIGILLAAVFPLFMGYAIVRNNIFQLDRFIRAALSNGAAAIFVFSIYFGVITALRHLFPGQRSGAIFQWFMVGFFFFLGFVFNHLRMKINHWVQKFLFRSQYSFQEKMQDLDQLLLSGLAPKDLIRKICDDLRIFLELKRLHCVLFSERYQNHREVIVSPEQAHGFDRAVALLESEGLFTELIAQKKPLRLAMLHSDRPEAFRQSISFLRSIDVALVIPVVRGERLLALFLLGSKTSGDDFDFSDQEQLQRFSERLAIVLDNTELTFETERQTRLAELGKMASILIHDIKNPLSTIRISAGSLKKRFKTEDPSFELATFIEEEVVRMNRAVQEILTYAKPVGVRLQQCSIHGLLHRLSTRMAPVLDAKNLRLVLKLCENETPIEADVDRLERALENLIVNAMEASIGPSEIHLRTERLSEHEKPQMRIIVQDYGKGMDPLTRDQVFKPFFTTKPSGTGLGLAIVQQVVDEHGAKIEMESQKGFGTRFDLTFHAMRLS